MNDKPKCPVFGCTIPRGIPHEHPAGVSELDDLAMRNLENAAGNISPETYQALHNALEVSRTQVPPMVPGRKLRDALLMAGRKPGDTLTLEEVKPGSFITLTGRIAFWIVLTVTMAIWIFVGVKS